MLSFNLIISGKYMYKGTNKKVGRVTGLDPPDFLMDSVFSQNRLSKNDAVFVDAIHMSPMSFDAIGHADFYPNGGNNCKYFRVSNIIS